MTSIWTTDDPHFTVAGTGRPGRIEDVPSPGTATFVTDLTIEILLPLYIGDTVTQVTQTLLDVNPRKTRVGDGAFSTYESFFENQRGERISRENMTLYTYVPNAPAASDGGSQGGGSAPAEKPARAIESRANTPVDWSKQRYWDDVNEGDEIGEVQYPLTVQRMVMAAGANRDFNSIHHSTYAAQAGGAADMYAMNTFHSGMWERAVREYIGLAGTIKQTGPFRMRIFSTVGDTVVVRGKVARKYTEGNEALVELEIQSLLASNGNVSVGPGPVTVQLSSWVVRYRSTCPSAHLHRSTSSPPRCARACAHTASVRHAAATRDVVARIAISFIFVRPSIPEHRPAGSPRAHRAVT